MRKEYLAIASLTLLLAAGLTFNSLNSPEKVSDSFESFNSDQQYLQYVSSNSATSGITRYDTAEQSLTVASGADSGTSTSGTRYGGTNNQVTGVRNLTF